MPLEKFSPEDDIFDDEEVLRGSHKPDVLPERDEQLKQYQDALKPVIKGSRPKNIFLVGQAGVGKTAGTELVTSRFTADQEEYDHVHAEFVYLNCKPLSNSYRVAANLVNKFRDEDDQIVPTGYPRDMIYDMLYDEFRDLDATHVIIILDEVDSIGGDDEILYELPRCNDHEIDPEKIYVGVIGISNDFTFQDGLSGRVKDSLCEEEIHFPPYDSNQLRTILAQRAEKAFHDDVLEDDVIPLCAAFAGQESGSARHALDLIYKSGELARSEGASEVTEEHVRQAEPLVRKDKIRNELERLPNQSHLTLYAVYALHAHDELPARTGRIYSEYKYAASTIAADQKTDRTIKNRLSQLALKGFVSQTRENRGEEGGRFDLYELGDVDVELVEEVLKNIDRFDELFTSGTPHIPVS